MKENLEEQIRIVKDGKDSLTVSRLAFNNHYKAAGWTEVGTEAEDQSSKSQDQSPKSQDQSPKTKTRSPKSKI